MCSEARVFLAGLVALALVFAPIPHSNRDEAKAFAPALVLTPPGAVATATAITVGAFIAAGMVIYLTCYEHQSLNDATEKVANDFRNFGRTAMAKFHYALAAATATVSFCPRTPPAIALPFPALPLQSTTAEEAAELLERMKVANQINQILHSPFFIGMNLAYQDLFKRYGLDLATTISTPTVLIPLVENLYRTNARFRTEYEEIGRGFDQLLRAAMAASGASARWNKLASITWENLGKCLKDPLTPFKILGIAGWISMYPAIFLTFKKSVGTNDSLGVALNLLLIGWMYLGESLKNPIGPYSSPIRLSRSIKECLTGRSIAVDLYVMIDLIYGIGLGAASLVTIKESIKK